MQGEGRSCECVICFEPIAALDGAVSLPCDCRVLYCHRCWDRALAASMTSCGRPLCPSCRCAMWVDFDATSGRLFFARAPALAAGDMQLVDDWRTRLCEQARPRQIGLLQRFGETVTKRSPDALDETSMHPSCVCGSKLHCISVRDRVMTYVEEEAKGRAPLSVIQRLMERPPIGCDLCDQRVDPSSMIWTCENGQRTVLHAAAYDVCEQCFVLYSGVTRVARKQSATSSDDMECF